MVSFIKSGIWGNIINPVPRISGIDRRVDWKFVLNGISDEHASSRRIELNRVPKPVPIWIGEDQLPRVATIGGLVEPRDIAFAGRHDHGGVGVEGLDAAEVQLLRAGRDSAGLPDIAAIFCA